MVRINKKALLLPVLILALALSSILVFPSKTTARACNDGAEIPIKVSQDGSEEGYCRGRGGVEGSSSGDYCNDGTQIPLKIRQEGAEEGYCNDHKGYTTAGGTSTNESGPAPAATIPRSEEEFQCDKGEKLDDCINRNPIIDTIRTIVNFLTVGVGIVITIVIIIAGIQFSTSQGDPQKAAKARGRAINAVVALFAYLFLSALLQWIIPGGLF